MSGIVKSIKKVFKTVKKVFKKVVSSDAFKIVMIAVAIYTGGVAMGAWGGAGATGTAVGAGAGAGGTQVAAGTTSYALGAEAAPVVSESLMGATAANAGASAGAAAGELTMDQILARGAADAAGNLSPLGSIQVPPMSSAPFQPQTAAGFFGDAARGAGNFVKENPLVTAMGMNSLTNAIAADQARKDAEKAEKEERARIANNLSVGDISLGVRTASTTAAAQRGQNPQGFINSRIRG